MLTVRFHCYSLVYFEKERRNEKMSNISQTQITRIIAEEKFYKSIKIFLKICQIFCVAPIDLHLLTKSIKINRWIKFCHYSWSFIMLTSILTSTYFQYSEFDSNMFGFLTRILYIGEYISGIVNSTIIIIGCNYQRNCYHQYFQRFISIDCRLHLSGGNSDLIYNGLKIFLYKFLLIYFLFFGCVVVTDFMYNRMDVKSFFRSSTVYSLPNIISALVLSEYVLLLNALRQRYGQIIKILSELPREKPIAMAISTISSKLLKPNDYPFIQCTIENVRLICLELADLQSDINSSFGLLIITTIVSGFIILSTQFYALYTFTEHLQDDDIWLIWYTILWIILHGGKSFFILYFNNGVQNEVCYIHLSILQLCLFGILQFESIHSISNENN